MALDKNKDGKITKDELPERMQDQITKGDTNKDGALDKDEIKKLAADLGSGFGGRGGPGGFNPFGGGPPGGGAFPSGGFRRGGVEGALEGLKLTDKKKETAEAVLKAHQENVRKLTDLARADLLLKMKDVLSEEEFKTFKEALDRPSGGFGDRGFGGGGRAPSAAPAGGAKVDDLEKKIEQLQKELESLKREIRR